MGLTHTILSQSFKKQNVNLPYITVSIKLKSSDKTIPTFLWHFRNTFSSLLKYFLCRLIDNLYESILDLSELYQYEMIKLQRNIFSAIQGKLSASFVFGSRYIVL